MLISTLANGQRDFISTSPDPSPVKSTSPLSLIIQTDLNSLDKPEYLTQLLKDKRQFAAFPNVFLHTERLLDQEINRVRMHLFDLNPRPRIDLPEPYGEKQIFQEKIPIPVQEHPEFNFVGRILGPRGMTAKQLEADTGCKIMVRGRGSMRDKQKEDQNRGKPNWEHLDEDLHVLIQCEDYQNRALVKLEHAKEEISKLLTPSAEGEDHLKKKQLTELAIINGTYRDPNFPTKKYTFPTNQISLGAPLILTPHMQQNLLATSNQPTLTTLPPTSFIQNNDGNYLQFLTPIQTIDPMGGLLTNAAHFYEYPSQTAFPFLTTTAAAASSSSSSGVTTRTTPNNASGPMTSTSSTISARYQPYTIQTPRLNRP